MPLRKANVAFPGRGDSARVGMCSPVYSTWFAPIGDLPTLKQRSSGGRQRCHDVENARTQTFRHRLTRASNTHDTVFTAWLRSPASSTIPPDATAVMGHRYRLTFAVPNYRYFRRNSTAAVQLCISILCLASSTPAFLVITSRRIFCK